MGRTGSMWSTRMQIYCQKARAQQAFGQDDDRDCMLITSPTTVETVLNPGVDYSIKEFTSMYATSERGTVTIPPDLPFEGIEQVLGTPKKGDPVTMFDCRIQKENSGDEKYNASRTIYWFIKVAIRLMENRKCMCLSFVKND